MIIKINNYVQLTRNTAKIYNGTKEEFKPRQYRQTLYITLNVNLFIYHSSPFYYLQWDFIVIQGYF